MIKFLIVRHGNSMSNLSKTFTGHKNSPLSELGFKQAELTCDYIYQNYKVDAIYSSDLLRTVDTVNPLSQKTGIEIITDKNLREMYGGKWEGMLFSEIPEKYPEDFKVWKETVGLARCTGGESYEEVQIRAIDCMNKIASKNEGKTVVVSTHGAIIRAFECAARGIPLIRMDEVPYVFNASVSEINYLNGRFEIVKTNISEHLADVLTAMPKGI